jgi:predicted Ser/Thr protein kinase
VTNAQDYALLHLARRQGLLLQLEPDLSAQAQPLAHRLLREDRLESRVVARLLRELAQGQFVCVHCAERLPYAFLSTLSDLRCPLCASSLEHFPNPLAMRTRRGLCPPPELTTTSHHVHEPPFSPGRFGELVLERELGRGANGVVFCARRPDGRRFALKLLHIGADDPEGLERFRQEASVAQRIRHPGIVRVHAIGRREGRYYCLMELVEGKTLGEHLRGARRLSPVEATHLIASVADAVAAAHAAGIVHRDLKPANILLDRTRRIPRVVDFGLALDQHRDHTLTLTGQMLGTPGYMAPEQFLGQRVDARCDVYALGAVLYECLCGRLPHQAPTILALASKVLSNAPRPPSALAAVPPALEQVILRALTRPPHERFADAAALAAALRASARVSAREH